MTPEEQLVNERDYHEEQLRQLLDEIERLRARAAMWERRFDGMLVEYEDLLDQERRVGISTQPWHETRRRAIDLVDFFAVAKSSPGEDGDAT